MFVLDYLKVAYDNVVVIPPFHTGHLGFIPGSEVNTTLLQDFSESPTHSEVVVAPIHHRANELVRISCTMVDGIGVVGRLIEAISSLNINITSLESSAIDRLHRHTVDMVGDLATAKNLNRDQSKRSILHHYSKFESLLPLHDMGYIRLFESIVAHCGDSLAWSTLLGRTVPMLRIQPIAKSERGFSAPATLRSVRDLHASLAKGAPDPRSPQRATADSYHVALKLPDQISTRLRNSIGQVAGEPLKYLLLSDTDERNLRIFFPTSAATERLLHIGFYHTDQPGALARLTDAVARAKFNILTSLIRNVNAEQNVWEVLLQYHGMEPFPKFVTPLEMCGWLAEQVSKSALHPQLLLGLNVEIGLPKYPRLSQHTAEKVPLVPQPGETGSKASLGPKASAAALLDQRAEELPSRQLGEFEEHSLRLIQLVQKRVTRGLIPRVFVSYPKNASRHALALRSALGTDYEWDEYQEPDGENILAQVQSKILTCDYFIGIWHHDETLPTAHGKYNVSPWMPFEYGLAFAEDKRSIIVHSDRLDERVWRRINPGIANPEYTDLDFRHDTVRRIVSYCKQNFK
jgi:hypothetical protein